jgi:glycine betaine catabolism B
MWRMAQIVSTEMAAEDIRAVLVRPSAWMPHKAGQHYELRLPGTDISRKYSVVSPPSRSGVLEFGIQLIANGELSPRVWDMKVGDELEIRGPLGESFVWDESVGGPLLLIGAGSGITPLLSIFDTYREWKQGGACSFVMSAKNEKRIMGYEKLKTELKTRFTEREPRIDKGFLAEVIAHTTFARVYVCGPDDFIDSIVDYLLELGIAPATIRSERFI